MSAIRGDAMRLVVTADVHCGITRAKTLEQLSARIEAESPDLIRAYWETPGDIRAPQGESWNEVCSRVNAAVDALIAAHTGQDLIIVAHFGAILTQVQRAERLTAEQVFSHKIDNLSVTELVCGPNGWSTTRINHLT